MLWIRGKPGSGKSVLAKFIRDTLLQRLPSKTTSEGSNLLVGDWFYHRLGGGVHIRHESFLRSILYHFAKRHSTIFSSFCLGLYRSMNPEKVLWQESDLLGMVLRVCHGHIPVLCIVDAVDEAESPDILSVIKDFVGETRGSNAKFIVLSRPAVEIERHMIGSPTIVMEDENHIDIEKIVCESLKSLPRALHAFHMFSEPTSPVHAAHSRPIQPRLRQLNSRALRFSMVQESNTLREIQERLISDAQGSILWVKTVLDELFRLATSSRPCTLVDLKQAAMRIPPEMKEYYARMVVELTADKPEKDIQEIHRLLMWVCAGSEFGSVTLEMLWEAMALMDDDFSSSTMDDIYQRRIPIMSFDELWRKIYVMCGPFLAIYNPGLSVEESRNYHYGATSVVQLMHQSVRDFLTEGPESGKLSFGAVQARHLLRSHLKSYLQLIARYFQRGETDVALLCTDLVGYLEERKLLPLALDILKVDDDFEASFGLRLGIPALAKPAEGSSEHQLASVLESNWCTFEDLPFACDPAPLPEDHASICGNNTTLLLSSNRLFYQGCVEGSVTAISNMLTLGWHKTPEADTPIIPYGVMLALSVWQSGRIQVRPVVRAGEGSYTREPHYSMHYNFRTARAERPIVEVATARSIARPEESLRRAQPIQVPWSDVRKGRGAQHPSESHSEEQSALRRWEATINIYSKTGITERVFYFKKWSEYLDLIRQPSSRQHHRLLMATEGTASYLALRDDVEQAIAIAISGGKSDHDGRAHWAASDRFHSSRAAPTPSYRDQAYIQGTERMEKSG